MYLEGVDLTIDLLLFLFLFFFQEKFPNVSVENITGLIGGFFLLRFINPAIVFPHSKYIDVFRLILVTWSVSFCKKSKMFFFCNLLLLFFCSILLEYMLLNSQPRPQMRRNFVLVSLTTTHRVVLITA